MSLVKCKKCGELISDKAKKCVHCGNIIIPLESQGKKRKCKCFKHDSANTIDAICDWKEATHDIYNSMWGRGDELRLNMHTYYASQMDVLMFCGDMEFTVLLIPLSPYDSYGEHYGSICDCIYDSMLLQNKNFELVGYNSLMCLATGIMWGKIGKTDLEQITEDLAESVYKFRQKLENYGYDATGFRLR